MEVPFARWSTADRQRGTRSDPKNEFGEPALGRHQDPWRVTQARHRGRSVHGLDLHGAAAGSAIAIRRPSGWRTRSPKRFRGTVHRNISFATTTEHSVLHSRLVCAQWGSGTGPHRTARPGKMGMLNA